MYKNVSQHEHVHQTLYSAHAIHFSSSPREFYISNVFFKRKVSKSAGMPAIQETNVIQDLNNLCQSS
jgi:hypothetical protein